jgi:nucleoid DNA-binding protein
MNKKELVDAIASRGDCTKKQADAMLTAFSIAGFIEA